MTKITRFLLDFCWFLILRSLRDGILEAEEELEAERENRPGAQFQSAKWAELESPRMLCGTRIGVADVENYLKIFQCAECASL